MTAQLIKNVRSRSSTRAGLEAAELSKQALQTGLQPFLLAGLDGTTGRPWDSGEIGKPQDTSSIGQVDAAQVLADGWRDAPEQEYAQDAELRAMLGPAGRQFPGLAPASQNDLICIINHLPTTDPQAEHIGGNDGIRASGTRFPPLILCAVIRDQLRRQG
jgi:hypothetical protein